jgi:high-affinity iron transporter
VTFPLSRSLWVLAFSAVASASWAQGQPGSQPDPRTWQRVVGILQYLEADYPEAVESGSAFELEEQQHFIAEALDVAQELGPAGKVFVERLENLQERIRRGVDPSGVRRDSGALVEDLVLAGGLARSPRSPPNLEAGRALFQVACAACHGAEGRGDVEIAATMEPKPANFHDDERMDGVSPYKTFNTLTFGVPGTAMPAFPTLTDEERWSLSFFVLTHRHPQCDKKAPRTSHEELANSTDLQLRQRYPEELVPCLRKNPPKADREALLLRARVGVEKALAQFAAGDAVGARRAVLDAYLEGLEPVEPQLRSSSPALIRRLEESFLRTRLAAENRSPHFQDDARELLSLLDQARRTAEAARGFWAVFWMSLLILLREGFEASIVLAALLAVLKKMDQRQHARWVHLGWVAALVAGALAWLVGRKALAAADRELLEGITALVAVGMLLYAALWLNARANIRKFMGELREKMQDALGRQSLFGLFAISFMAMFRESMETVIFLEGLAVDGPSATAWGAGTGIVALVGLVFFIRKVGYVLPMKTLFNASTVLLVVTAVMLLGKGLHAFQEVGSLPLVPMPGVSVPWLGIYPDAVSFLPQLFLAATPLAWMGWKRRKPLPAT